MPRVNTTPGRQDSSRRRRERNHQRQLPQLHLPESAHVASIPGGMKCNRGTLGRFHHTRSLTRMTRPPSSFLSPRFPRASADSPGPRGVPRSPRRQKHTPAWGAMSMDDRGRAGCIATPPRHPRPGPNDHNHDHDHVRHSEGGKQSHHVGLSFTPPPGRRRARRRPTRRGGGGGIGQRCNAA